MTTDLLLDYESVDVLLDIFRHEIKTVDELVEKQTALGWKSRFDRIIVVVHRC